LITIRQVKAARALLGWSQAVLAERSGVSEPTIARLEAVDGELGGREDTAEKIRAAIEAAGIEFLQENDGGAGVRLRKHRRIKPRR
jgi:transcriptional regulator with XRE-family HTH domain